jgi:exodeoxyribonuclease VII large subunit
VTNRQPPLFADGPASEREREAEPAGAALEPNAALVLPVSALVARARGLMERGLGLVWVKGEISNFTRASSGHCYFNLKDEQAQVRCVFFRQKAQFTPFALKDGQQVEVRACPSIYEPKGEFQLNVETMRLAGLGALYERFARLKARLEAEGWFAPERKRALPRFPRRVGIVTSTQAAALSDLITTLRRRWPALAVIIYPAAVQGDGAAREIAAAIRLANARAEVDVLIVGRGGGSIEDLWAFNEVAVARAFFESRLPVVSAVGHETDFTIADFVADVRAPTPTAAATLVVPDRHALARHVAGLATRWARAHERALETRMQRVDGLARRLVHPVARLVEQCRAAHAQGTRLARAVRHLVAVRRLELDALARRQRRQLRQPLPQASALADCSTRLRRAFPARLERVDARLAALAQSLAHLNPQRVLERGYAIVATADGVIVQDADRVAVGDDVALTFARGGAAATITRTEK